jgi:hypothetical protein
VWSNNGLRVGEQQGRRASSTQRDYSLGESVFLHGSCELSLQLFHKTFISEGDVMKVCSREREREISFPLKSFGNEMGWRSEMGHKHSARESFN